MILRKQPSQHGEVSVIGYFTFSLISQAVHYASLRIHKIFIVDQNKSYFFA